MNKSLFGQNGRLSCQLDDMRFLLTTERAAHENCLSALQEERELRATAERALSQQRSIAMRYERYVDSLFHLIATRGVTNSVASRIATEYYHALHGRNDSKFRRK